MRCECGSGEFDQDHAAGTTCCVHCGMVVEENVITSEVTFTEGPGGAMRMDGQFVNAEASGPSSMGSHGRRINTGLSREQTIAHARERIRRLASTMGGLSEHHIDQALRSFKLALNANFTKGRRSDVVAGACLYISCRESSTSHLLIDFSDALHISVFVLGGTFNRLLKTLNMSLDYVDPCTYIDRFASKMELGEKKRTVAHDAVRILQRMKRDWMAVGRRPNGLCGACLLMAARMHGFKRTEKEIMIVVKIGEQTLRNRLNEFARSDAGQISVADFKAGKADSLKPMDPPALRPKHHSQHYHNNAAEKETSIQSEIAHYNKETQRVGAEIQQERKQQLQSLLMVPTTEQNKIGVAPLLPHFAPNPPLPSPSPPKSLAETDNKSANIADNRFAGKAKLETFSDIDDDEINDFLLDEDEIAERTRVWEAENQEYYDTMEARKRQRMQQAAEKPRKVAKKPFTFTASRPAPTNTSEAIDLVLQVKAPHSKRLNLDAVKQRLAMEEQDEEDEDNKLNREDEENVAPQTRIGSGLISSRSLHPAAATVTGNNTHSSVPLTRSLMLLGSKQPSLSANRLGSMRMSNISGHFGASLNGAKLGPLGSNLTMKKASKTLDTDADVAPTKANSPARQKLAELQMFRKVAAPIVGSAALRSSNMKDRNSSNEKNGNDNHADDDDDEFVVEEGKINGDNVDMGDDALLDELTDNEMDSDASAFDTDPDGEEIAMDEYEQ